VRAYLSVAAARFKASIQYRAAAAAGFVTQLFFGLVMVMALQAFYASGRAGAPVSFQSAVNYVWLGQAFLAMLPWNVDRDVQALIRNGNVVFEFVRPLDLQLTWLAHALAGRLSSTVLRAVPLILTVALAFPLIGPAVSGLTGPASAAAFAAFLVTYALTILLSAAITVFMNVVTLLFLSADGLNVFMNALVTIFSGMIIPLPLFPDALQPFLLAQPFAGLVDFPFRYYTGAFPVSRLPVTLPLQACWIAFFALAGRALLARAKKKLTIQGG
jgi:ABC-2 type transport system permease protein